MIYFDWNATTPLHPEVAEHLARAFRDGVDRPGNASSVHQGGRHARSRLDTARGRLASILGCEPKEIVITGGGSEADALALKGAFAARPDRARTKVVISTIEHPAILQAAKQLEAAGATVIRVPPDPDGVVPAEAMIAHVGPDTALVSLMWANNETGALQPVADVARACRRAGVLFHTDAVQAAGKVRVTLHEVDADLLSISAHKFGGPAGIGALVVRRGVAIDPLVPGHQELGRRGGTQNLPYFEALALAFELAHRALDTEIPRLTALRDRFEQTLARELDGITVNAGAVPRVPNTSNLRFAGVDGEALLIGLDLAGICVSAGAACASGSLTPSHVLSAMGLTPAQAHESLRFSIGRTTTDAEIDTVIAALKEQVTRARAA
ncbi:MAG: cysteine desulfurase [Myxococcaceae bacterium]|nr:cysteine desulfurase [Myxococcaceae bacterium]